jgi:hypothetical protein
MSADIEYGTTKHPNAPWWTSTNQALADLTIWQRQLEDTRDEMAEHYDGPTLDSHHNEGDEQQAAGS